MNDKCAAGTGRFLEHTAARLGVAVADLGPRALAASAEEPISSTCTVFAESEIISLIGRGADVDAIIRGLHRSLVGRIVAMARTVGLTPPLILSGGVALNPAVRAMMAEAAGMPVALPPHPQLMGAYGAALLALEGLEPAGRARSRAARSASAASGPTRGGPPPAAPPGGRAGSPPPAGR